jgi:hypothetical protein
MHVRLRRSGLFAVVAATMWAVPMLMAGAPAAQAATPVLPSQDPFYTYSGSTPLLQIAPRAQLTDAAVRRAVAHSSCSATVVASRGDSASVDVRARRPFAEIKEVIVGFDLLDCADLDEAIEVARSHPMARVGRIETAYRAVKVRRAGDSFRRA